MVCMSLAQVVGVEPSTTGNRAHQSSVYKRLLVIRRDEVRVVCPVDEVHGIHRIHLGELKEVPTTVAKARVTYSTAMLSWRERAVGILDDQLLFHSLKRSFS